MLCKKIKKRVSKFVVRN